MLYSSPLKRKKLNLEEFLGEKLDLQERLLDSAYHEAGHALMVLLSDLGDRSLLHMQVSAFGERFGKFLGWPSAGIVVGDPVKDWTDKIHVLVFSRTKIILPFAKSPSSAQLTLEYMAKKFLITLAGDIAASALKGEVFVTGGSDLWLVEGILINVFDVPEEEVDEHVENWGNRVFQMFSNPVVKCFVQAIADYAMHNSWTVSNDLDVRIKEWAACRHGMTEEDWELVQELYDDLYQEMIDFYA